MPCGFSLFQIFWVKCHAVFRVFSFFILFETFHQKLNFLSMILICHHRMFSFFVRHYVFLIFILNLVKLVSTFWIFSPKIEILEWNAMRLLLFSKFWSEMPCGFSFFQFVHTFRNFSTKVFFCWWYLYVVIVWFLFL